MASGNVQYNCYRIASRLKDELEKLEMRLEHNSLNNETRVDMHNARYFIKQVTEKLDRGFQKNGPKPRTEV